MDTGADDVSPRLSFEKLTEAGQELESVVMAACRTGQGYSTKDYLELRQTATLEELMQSIFVRRALEWQSDDMSKQSK